MMFFEDENKRYRKQLTKLGGNKVLRSRPRAATFIVSCANFKSHELFGDSSDHRVKLRAEQRVTD